MANDTAVSPVVGTVVLVLVTATLAGLLLADDWWHPSAPTTADVHAHGADHDGQDTIDTLVLELRHTSTNAPVDATVRIATATTHAQTTVDAWHTGERERIPCLEPGPHELTIAIDDTAVDATRLDCDQAFHVPADADDDTGDSDTVDGGRTPFHQVGGCDRPTLVDAAPDATTVDRLVDLCLLVSG